MARGKFGGCGAGLRERLVMNYEMNVRPLCRSFILMRDALGMRLWDPGSGHGMTVP